MTSSNFDRDIELSKPLQPKDPNAVKDLDDATDPSNSGPAEQKGIKKTTGKVPIYKKKWFWLAVVFGLAVIGAMIAVGVVVSRQHRNKNKKSASVVDDDVNPIVVQSNDTNEDWWDLDSGYNYTMDRPSYKAEYGIPKDRHYYFNITKIEHVLVSGATRNLTVINGHYPGPLIQANSGDTIYIHVNNMQDDPVTIHCHGLFFPTNPFDDGASSINTCPIKPQSSYTYKVPTSEDQYGTYWYHSHWSTQYADGVMGPLVLHSPKEDALMDSYDYDHVYVVNDYYYDDASTYMSDYLAPGNENAEPTPDDGLMDGEWNQNPTYMRPTNSSSYREALYLDPEKIHRIRVVNSGFFDTFTFSVDQHKLKIVEADGTVLEPYEDDSVDIGVAQRYSFLLDRQSNDTSSYWVHSRFNPACLATDPGYDQDIRAVITYDRNYTIPDDQQTWEYRANDKCLGYDLTHLRTKNQTVPRAANGSLYPDVLVTLDSTFGSESYGIWKGFFNGHTWHPLKNTSTLYRSLYDDNYQLEGVDNYDSENNQYVLNFDTRGQIVDFVINNYDDGSHPFHLHGHKFWVIGMSDTGTFYESMYEGNVDLTNPVLRDTVQVGPFGWAVIRFVVDNPGVWPFHCHIGWHMEAGLLLQVRELESELKNMTQPDGWKEMCGYDFSTQWG